MRGEPRKADRSQADRPGTAEASISRRDELCTAKVASFTPEVSLRCSKLTMSAEQIIGGDIDRDKMDSAYCRSVRLTSPRQCISNVANKIRGIDVGGIRGLSTLHIL